MLLGKKLIRAADTSLIYAVELHYPFTHYVNTSRAKIA